RLALTRAQLVQGGTDEPGQFGLLGASPDVGARGRIRQVGVLTETYLRRAQPAVALVAGDRVQPGPELARIAQAVEPAGGDDEGVFHRVGGILRLAQHPAAVTVQGLGVLVVGGGEAGQVAGHDGRDDLAVVHAQTVVEPPAYGLVCRLISGQVRRR